MSATPKFFALCSPIHGPQWWFLNHIWTPGNPKWADEIPVDTRIDFTIFSGNRRPGVLGNDLCFVVSPVVKKIMASVCGDTISCGEVDIYSDRLRTRLIDDNCERICFRAGGGPRREDKGYHLLITDYCKTDPTLKDAVGIHFDHSTWTGDHAFVLPNDSTCIITETLMRKLRDANVEGCIIEPVETFRIAHRDRTATMLMSKKRSP